MRTPLVLFPPKRVFAPAMKASPTFDDSPSATRSRFLRSLVVYLLQFPGGKPRKEDKFSNWVKSAFKVKDEEVIF